MSDKHDDNAFFSAWKLYIHHHRRFDEWFNKKFPVQGKIITEFLEKQKDNEKPDDDADYWKK